MRQVQNDGQQSAQASPPATVAGSPPSSSTQLPVAPQSNRVARIQFSDQHGSDVQKHDELVFDVRTPISEAHAFDGCVNVVQFYIGDEPDAHFTNNIGSHMIRTMLESVPDETEMHNILLDSGADASVFPASMAELGCPSNATASLLRDAQGNTIPLHGKRDVEIHLMDMQGRSVTIKESVALSDQISQPILCFGRLLESGWSIDGKQQTLTHGSVSIPIEMQHRSMTLRGWIRAVREEPVILEPLCIRNVRAEIFNELAFMRIGWDLSPEGVGSGKHYANCFQDPTLACPTMSGRKFRTTLIQHEEQWLVMELCEPLDSIIDLSAEFYGFEGDRFVVTVITTAEKAPHVMGFRLLDDDEDVQPALQVEERPHADVAAPIAPEDEVAGVDIDVEPHDAGQDIQGQLVVSPERGDHMVVNGVELYRETALATLREACAFYNLSQSGSKSRCFDRLWEHQKRLELQIVLSAARETEAEQQRQPKPQRLAEPPDEKTQQLHNLTHLPYQEWWPHCVTFRARPDRHQRDGSVKDSGIPTVSFDFAYTKAVEPGGQAQQTSTVIALILVDSSTNFTGCVPISKKNDFDVMVREIIQFSQILGHGECNFLCDNEPSIMQVQKKAVQARRAMGLMTHSKTPAAYTHGNSLCENTVNRVRGLAGALMNHVEAKLSIKLNTNHGLWSWALRHASWLLNRFSVVHGATPYELVYAKVYKGRMTEFAEPAFAYTHTAMKGNPRWQRVIVLGKTESQDTYVVFTGSTIMLTRSVRRIATDWKCHLGFFLHFNSPTWRFKAGFGGRIIPTKRSVEGQSASFVAQTAVLPSPFHDKDAEDVKQKMLEEKTEARESLSMGQEDKPSGDTALRHDDKRSADVDLVGPSTALQPSSSPSMPSRPGNVVVDSVFDDDVDTSFLSTMEGQVDMQHDTGQSAPVTPPTTSMQLPPTPRHQHETRAHGPDEEDHEAKRARVEAQKKQKITRMMEFNESMIRTVKVGADEFATLDDYENEFDLDADTLEDEFWCDEDQLRFDNVPDALWSNASLDKQPQAPDAWIDELADAVEIDRLLKMGVLQKAEECQEVVSGSLTTRSVYDWRIKDSPDGTKKWMRRSRFVAREFATLKRSDTYSPATGSHTHIQLGASCLLEDVG